MPGDDLKHELSRSLWTTPLVLGGYVVAAWIICMVLGIGSGLPGRLFDCHGPEVGDPGSVICEFFDEMGGLALLAAFGAPLFMVGALFCLIWAALGFVWWFWRRK